MTAWTSAELGTIEETDELDLRSERADGSLRDPVTMWVVRHGDAAYVRPVKGPGGWYRGVLTRHEGSVSCGGVTKDVTFVEVDDDPALNAAIDDAYRAKYRRYADDIVGSVTNDLSRSATLRLDPRRPS
ncbi:DUF2255 family protein [Phytomonospora sp. NPDC050363]|uniref:DUF2255 family protein n=1 Tax=Phytomonospora sp. NPDC050363 TaxID=3155642 RepID=UPI0034081DB5